MSNKDASKKRIMSFVGKLSFSSKDNDEAGLDANHKDKPAKSKQRPASIQLSSNSKTHEGLGSNSSEWVESMEHIKDNGNNIKKKKKKKKKGLKGDLMDLSPRKQPVKLKHAPSIADMLTPAITTIKEPESLEQELRYKLEIANQEIATLRALIIEKDHLIALLTLGSKDNHFNNSYTSSDTDDCNQTNEVDESKSIERKHLANLPFSLSSPSLRTTLPPKTLPQSTSTPSLLSLSGEIKPPSLPVTPPLRLPSIPTAPDPPKRKFSLKLRKIPSLKRTISTFVSVQVPQTNSPLSVSAPASPVTPPSFFSFGHLLVPPSKRDNSSSHPSSPNLSTTPAPWSAAGPLFPGINSPPATPPTTPSNQMKTLNPPSSAPSTPPTSAVPPSSTTPPTSATRPSSATLPTSATPPTLATPPTSVILPSTSTPRTLFNSIGSATPPDAMTLLNQITTLRPPTLLLSDLLTSESPPTLPTTSIPLEPQSASGINPRETAQIPFDPAPLKPQSLPNSTPRETLQSSPSAVPAPVKSKSAIGSRKLTDRIGHLSINTSITATQPALNSPDSPRLRHSAPSGSFSFISAFPGIPSKRKVFSPPPSPSRISPSPPFASDIAVIQSPTSTEAKPARKTSAPPQLSDTRPLSSSSSYDIIPRSGTPTPSPTKNPRTLSLKITPPSPLLISSPSLTSAHAVLAVTPGSPHTSPPHTSSPRTRTSTAIAETMPLVSQLQEKKNVLLQIESCERAYLLQLSIIIEIFLKPLREQAQTPKPVITTIEIKSIFSDIEFKWEVNSVTKGGGEALWSASKYFLESLGSHIRRSDIDNIGAFFLRIVDTFRVYTGYVQNYYKAASTIALSKQSSPSFVAFLKKKELELKTGKDLVILLLSPINRIHQFTIQLKLLQEVTAPTDPSYHSLGIAHAKMSHFAANLRERAKVVEAKHKVQTIQDAMHGKFISFVQSHRLYVMEGQLDLLIPTPSAFSPRGRRSQTNTRTSPEIAYSLPLPASPNSFVTSKSFYCFLFNDLLVLTKQKKNHYDYKRMYEVKDLDVISVKSELGNLLQIIHGASATTEHVFIVSVVPSTYWS